MAEKEKSAEEKVTDSGVIVKKAVEEGTSRDETAIYDEDFEKSDDPFANRPVTTKPQTLEDIAVSDPSNEDESDEASKKSEDGRAEPTGKKEDEESEDKEKGQQEKDSVKDMAGDKEEEEEEKGLKSKLTKITQENALLKDLLATAQDSTKGVTELQAQLEKVKPFLPMIEGMSDVKELAEKIQVPESEMTGEDEEGNKIATEADKRRVLASSEQGIATLIQRAVERDRIQRDKVINAQQVEAQGLMQELQRDYNEGKKFNQKTLEEIAVALGTKIGFLNDPSKDRVTKKLILEGAYLKARENLRNNKVIEKTPEEIEEEIRKAKEKEDQATIIKSKSNLRPSKELDPKQKAQIAIWEGMAKVADRGRLPE